MQTTFRLPFDPLRLVASFGSLWITGQGGPRRYRGVVRLDPRSGRILAVARRRGGLGTALAATDRWIWVGGPDTFPPGQPERAGVYFVYRIDPRRGAVVGRIRLRSTVIDLAADGPELWISGWYAIVKLSARGNVLMRLPITGAGWSISRVRGGAWVAHTFNGTRRDRPLDLGRRTGHLPARTAGESRRLLRPVPLADSPWQVSATTRGTWIALGGFSHHVEWVPDVPAPEPLKVPVRGLVDGIQASRDGVWVAQVRPNRLSKVC